MIQRIQTLYLLIAAVLVGLIIFIPMANYLSSGSEYALTAFGIVSADSGGSIATLPYLAVLAAVAALIPFVTIFLFRNRLLQIRLCIVEIVLLAGVVGLQVYYLYHGGSAFGASDAHSTSYSFVNIFPLIALILMWLAVRAIGKDEALVRSLDRLR